MVEQGDSRAAVGQYEGSPRHDAAELEDEKQREPQVSQFMKTWINGPITVVTSVCGLLLAIAAWRAWELNDDIHGILMAMVGRLFSLLPKPDDAEIPAFRADSIFSLTETKLILVFRVMAVMLSVLAISSALWARLRGVFSAYYAAAVLTGFGTCMLVHKLLALWSAVMILIAVVVIESTNKRRYKSSNTNAVQRR